MSDSDIKLESTEASDPKVRDSPTKPDNFPAKNWKRPPGSQAGRYKRFDNSISGSAERVIQPRIDDVVFGRGKGCHDHPGNKIMRAIIRKHKKDYAATHRSKKRQIAEQVYSEITQNGAKFLHKIKDEDAYAVVDLNLALQKLSNTLRCRKSCLVDSDKELEEEDGLTSSTSSKSSSNLDSASIRAAAAAGIEALRNPVLGKSVPPLTASSLVPPPVGLSAASSRSLEADPLLRQRLLGELASAGMVLPPTSLTERELLLRSAGLAHSPFGVSSFGNPLLSSVQLLPGGGRLNEFALAEQEFLMARNRLRSAALGL